MPRSIASLHALLALPTWASNPGEPPPRRATLVRRFKVVVSLMLLLVLCRCWHEFKYTNPETPGDVVHKGYSGPTLPDDEVATLQLPLQGRLLLRGDEWASGSQVFASNSPVEQVTLLPGERDLSFILDFYDHEYCRRREVTLIAGHVYVAGTKEYFLGGLSPVVLLWIEDTSTNEIVFGRKPKRQVLPGQVNPPVSFREGVESLWHDECMQRGGQDHSAATDERRKRREMIISLGDKVWASPIGNYLSNSLTDLLDRIARYNEQIEAERCPRTPLPLDQLPRPKYTVELEKQLTPCKGLRFELHHFIALTEKRARKGKISDATAADLSDTATSILSRAEEPE